MTGSEQKKKKNSKLIEVWGRLKEKILVLLSDLDSFKSNQEVIIERYEKKLREKSKEAEEWEKDYKELNDLVTEVRRAIGAINDYNQQQKLLDILNRR